MAANFWEAQRRARSRTSLYVILFIVLTAGIAVGAETLLRTVAPDDYNPQFPYLGLFFVCVTCFVAGYNYLMYKQYGGSYVAESVGGRLVTKNTQNFKEQQLLNIVEEMAIAASVPVPKVYVLPANQINAFAAGLQQNQAAVAVSQGCLDRLTRDELQGVVGHEIGHIYNRDMRMTMILAAMIMGFFVILYLGLRMLQFAPQSRYEERSSNGKRNGNPVVVIAITLLIAGAVSWLAGKILASSISRQREYLADACSVQFTRNPDGIVGALKKIHQDSVNDMPHDAMAFSQMFLNDTSLLSSLFATHPPLEKRIAAIIGRTYSFDPKDKPD